MIGIDTCMCAHPTMLSDPPTPLSPIGHGSHRETGISSPPRPPVPPKKVNEESPVSQTRVEKILRIFLKKRCINSEDG